MSAWRSVPSKAGEVAAAEQARLRHLFERGVEGVADRVEMRLAVVRAAGIGLEFERHLGVDLAGRFARVHLPVVRERECGKLQHRLDVGSRAR